MIFFLYGDDSYRSRRKLNEIIDRYKETHKKGLSLRFFDGEKLDYQDFKEEVFSSSMFKEKKLTVVEGINKNQDFKQKFLKDSKKIISSENIILFFEPGNIPKDSFSRFLEKNGKFQAFDLLEGQRLRSWAEKEFKNYSAKIDEAALIKLINFIGNNLWALSNEIRKLASFKNGKVVETKNVELLVKPKIEADIFKTIDSLAEKKNSQALFLIHKHLKKGDNPLYLLAMINFQFRNLLAIKDLMEKNTPYYLIQKKTGLHPFIVRKSYELAQKFTFSQLKKIYQKIFEIDFKIKTGKIGYEAGLDLLIAEI